MARKLFRFDQHFPKACRDVSLVLDILVQIGIPSEVLHTLDHPSTDSRLSRTDMGLVDVLAHVVLVHHHSL